MAARAVVARVAVAAEVGVGTEAGAEALAGRAHTTHSRSGRKGTQDDLMVLRTCTRSQPERTAVVGETKTGFFGKTHTWRTTSQTSRVECVLNATQATRK